ncbi:MAG: ribbon-helix-helix protein, CopG family [Actinomycetota bacterium]|nr:ribbon-helix-helix protein, CopG family [Actinomycetota bacterium]
MASRRVRISATISSELLEELDLEAREKHRSRSQLLEECIKIWRGLKLREDMKEGYLERVKPDRKLAEEDLAAQVETLPEW